MTNTARTNNDDDLTSQQLCNDLKLNAINCYIYFSLFDGGEMHTINKQCGDKIESFRVLFYRRINTAAVIKKQRNSSTTFGESITKLYQNKIQKSRKERVATTCSLICQRRMWNRSVKERNNLAYE